MRGRGPLDVNIQNFKSIHRTDSIVGIGVCALLEMSAETVHKWTPEIIVRYSGNASFPIQYCVLKNIWGSNWSKAENMKPQLL